MRLFVNHSTSTPRFANDAICQRLVPFLFGFSPCKHDCWVLINHSTSTPRFANNALCQRLVPFLFGFSPCKHDCWVLINQSTPTPRFANDALCQRLVTLFVTNYKPPTKKMTTTKPSVTYSYLSVCRLRRRFFALVKRDWRKVVYLGRRKKIKTACFILKDNC